MDAYLETANTAARLAVVEAAWGAANTPDPLRACCGRVRARRGYADRGRRDRP
jgi:hypothetical protein